MPDFDYGLMWKITRLSAIIFGLAVAISGVISLVYYITSDLSQVILAIWAFVFGVFVVLDVGEAPFPAFIPKPIDFADAPFKSGCVMIFAGTLALPASLFGLISGILLAASGCATIILYFLTGGADGGNTAQANSNTRRPPGPEQAAGAAWTGGGVGPGAASTRYEGGYQSSYGSNSAYGPV